MKYKHYVALGLSCIIFLPPILLLYFPDITGQKIENVTPLDLMTLFYTIAFVWVTSTAFILTDLTQYKRSLREDRKNHTKDICKIYKLLLGVIIREENTKKRENLQTKRDEKIILKFPSEYKAKNDFTHLEQIINGENDTSFQYISKESLDYYDNYRYFDYAITHLKHRTYKNIDSHWQKIQKMLEESNTKIRFIVKLIDTLDEKMKQHLPDLTMSWKFDQHNYYYHDTVLQFILSCFKSKQYSTSSLELRPTGDKSSKWIMPKYARTPHMVIEYENNTYFETYKKILEDIIKDEKLKEMFDNEINSDVKILEVIEQFTNELENLIKRLEAGELIEGKCPIGF